MCFYDERPNELDDYQWTRTFKKDVNESELVWHRDKKDRRVRVVQGNDWQFQEDNRLPFVINPGDVLLIKKETYHRLIRGTNDLILEIEEND